jgi:hypothetical protein
MKKEIIVWNISEGKITEIKMDDELYMVHLKQEKPAIELHIQGTSLVAQGTPSIVPDRGTRLGTRGHTAIYDNILNKLKTTPYDKHYEVFKQYYPLYLPISIKTAITQYRNEMQTPLLTTTPAVKIRKPYRRHYKRKPEDGVAFVKTYGIWVKGASITKVKQAVHKFGYDYKPTHKTILSETGLTKSQLAATLKYMKEKGEIRAIRNDNTMELTYQPIIRVDELK